MSEDNKPKSSPPAYSAFKARLVKQEKEPRYYFLKRFYLFARISYALISVMLIGFAILLMFKITTDAQEKESLQNQPAELKSTSLRLEIFKLHPNSKPNQKTENLVKVISPGDLNKNTFIYQGHKIVAKGNASLDKEQKPSRSILNNKDGISRNGSTIEKAVLNLTDNQSIEIFAGTELILGEPTLPKDSIFHVRIIKGKVKTRTKKTVFSPGVILHTPACDIPDRGNVYVEVERGGFFTIVKGNAQIKIKSQVFFLGEDWYGPAKNIVQKVSEKLYFNLEGKSIRLPFIYALSYKELSSTYSKTAEVSSPLDAESMLENLESDPTHTLKQTLIKLMVEPE